MSRERVFVTGGAGFIGRHFRDELRSTRMPVTWLDRSGSMSPPAPGSDELIVRGSLLDSASYREALAECGVIVHLAAATGKASRTAHRADTVQATRVLCETAVSVGLSRILLVSSIAVVFDDRSGYPYALAKEEAESMVRGSGLSYSVVRPTMVLGPGAPILGSLETLAHLPVLVVPGTGRARVQPIAVRDLVKALVRIVREDHFSNDTLTLGGPEILTMEELLQRLRVLRTGRRGRAVHVPLAGLEIPLRVAEALGMRRLLPVTAGQLSSFRNDGISDGPPPEGMVSVAEMIQGPDSGAPSDASDDEIDGECTVFVRHLLGRMPDRGTLDAYRKAVRGVAVLSPGSARDEAVLRFARRGVLATRLADSWAAIFDRKSALRKRLIMLLGILEVRAPMFEHIDRGAGGSPVKAVPLILWQGVVAAVRLVAATLVMTPIVLAARVAREVR